MELKDFIEKSLIEIIGAIQSVRITLADRIKKGDQGLIQSGEAVDLAASQTNFGERVIEFDLAVAAGNSSETKKGAKGSGKASVGIQVFGASVGGEGEISSSEHSKNSKVTRIKFGIDLRV